MLQVLDIFYTAAHLLLIGFNLLGWIWPKTRSLHLWSVGITLFCWLVIGMWFGFGYCPLTDWHWQVKEQSGERNLPASFITYLLNNVFGMGINEQLSDVLTVVLFALAILVGVYFRFLRKSQ